MIKPLSIQQVVRAGLQSATIMTLADVTTQFVIEGKQIEEKTTTRDGMAGGGVGDEGGDNDQRRYASSSPSHSKQTQKMSTESSTVLSTTTENLDDNNNKYSLSRTFRWTVCGLFLHGPYFLMGFSWLDRRFPSPTTTTRPSLTSSLKFIGKKTMTAQIVLFPPYLVLLFGAMGMLEHHPNMVEKIKTHVPQAFITGSVYWPFVNSINFAVIPPSGRVTYVALCAGVWNSYLSWSNQR
mmetsp:Transcript_1466/g.3256  ORF Transcript_1466/g.3256 Transcript_1466/m.3256 type:complete len:238 (-) Transcript_1466:1012-1725(-)